MKKPVCLAFALLMLLPLLFACGKKNGEGTETTAGSGKPDESQSPYLDQLPEGLNFGGQEVSIFYAIYDGNFDCKLFELEGDASAEGDRVSQMVFARNETVQDRLGVTLRFVQSVEGYGAPTGYQRIIENNIIATQSTEYDLIYHRAANAVVHSNMGYFRNVNDLPYVDWSREYWFYNQMESVSLNSANIYIILGDLLVSNYANMTSMFFNADLFETVFPDRSADELYNLVKDDAWTWETYFDIVAQGYVDSDGETGETLGDIYGAHYEESRTAQYYPYTSGLQFSERDDRGFPKLTFNTERTIDMVEELYGFMYENDGTTLLTYDQAEEKFLNASLIFYSYFLSRGSMISKNVDFKYGVLPYPKYDELADYASTILTGAGVYVIPYTITDEERLNCIGATLEALCARSSQTVMPEYYESVVKIREAGTPQNREMIEIIRDHLNFDVTLWMSDSLGQVALSFRQTLIDNKSDNYAATWEKFGTAYETLLNMQITRYNERIQ